MIGAGLNLFWGHLHYFSGGIWTFPLLSDTYASAPIAERAILYQNTGALAHVTDSEGKVLRPPEKYKILPHFDINNLSVALKLKKLEVGLFHLEL